MSVIKIWKEEENRNLTSPFPSTRIQRKTMLFQVTRKANNTIGWCPYELTSDSLKMDGLFGTANKYLYGLRSHYAAWCVRLAGLSTYL